MDIVGQKGDKMKCKTCNTEVGGLVVCKICGLNHSGDCHYQSKNLTASQKSFRNGYEQGKFDLAMDIQRGVKECPCVKSSTPKEKAELDEKEVEKCLINAHGEVYDGVMPQDAKRIKDIYTKAICAKFAQPKPSEQRRNG